MAYSHDHPESTATTTSITDGLVFAAGNNKPSLVRLILEQAPTPARVIEAAWPAAVAAAAEAGDAYVMEILLQHQHRHQQLNSQNTSSALHMALLVAAEKGYEALATLLLKERAGHFRAGSGVIEAAMAKAVKQDHASVLQALLDRAKPDPYVLLAVDTDEGTPAELAAAWKSQRCAGVLKAYEKVWRQRTLQLLIRATLVDSSRLSMLPFVVLATGVLEYLAERRGPAEPAGSIEGPARSGKRELEEEAEEEDEEEFPLVLLQHQRGKKRRKSAGGRRTPRQQQGGNGCSRVLRPRKAKTWTELLKLPLPNDSFTGACAF